MTTPISAQASEPTSIESARSSSARNQSPQVSLLAWDSYSLLVVTFVVLVSLTLVNVALRAWDFGPWNLWINLSLSLIKALLVGAVFMHLGKDRGQSNAIVAITIATGLLFILFAASDVLFSRPDVTQFQDAKPDRVMPAIKAPSGP